MIVIGTSVAVTMGLFTFCGRALNMITMVIPSLITIYGISDVVHLVYAYQRTYRNDPAAQRPAALVSAAAEVVVPCFLTSLTTAAGFSSLAFSRIMIIRDLGVFTAAGIMITFCCSFVLALGLPGLFPRRTPHQPLTGFLEAVRGFVARRPTIVLIAAACLLAGAVPGAARIRVDTFSIGLLKRQHPVRAASDYIEEHFGNYTPVHLLLETDRQILDPRWMHAARDLRRALGAHPQTARWIGADSLPCLSNADSTSELQDCLDSINPALTASFISPRRDALRLSGAARMMSAAGFKALLADLESFAGARLIGTPLRVRASGYLAVYVRMMDYIADTQIGSSLIALAVVLVLMGFVAGNPGRALCAAAANIFPVVLVIGFMGWSGIPLDVATVTIAAISIGIVVDDTLHVLYRLRTRSTAGESAGAAMDRTVREIGRPVLATSLILTAGYAAMLLAQVRSIIFFGLLSSIAVVAALAGDLLLLPALVHRFAAPRDKNG
jgi:predicted RND superfamily exporter protein